MLSMSRARVLLGRPRNAACCAVLGLAVAAGMAGAASVDRAALGSATAANRFVAPLPTTPQVASTPSAAPVYRPAAAGGLPTGPAPRP
jgi:hypothetical protein